MAVLAGGEDVMRGVDRVEFLGAFPRALHNLESFVVHRNQSFARFCLAGADEYRRAEEVNISPL